MPSTGGLGVGSSPFMVAAERQFGRRRDELIFRGLAAAAVSIKLEYAPQLVRDQRVCEVAT